MTSSLVNFIGFSCTGYRFTFNCTNSSCSNKVVIKVDNGNSSVPSTCQVLSWVTKELQLEVLFGQLCSELQDSRFKLEKFFLLVTICISVALSDWLVLSEQDFCFDTKERA